MTLTAACAPEVAHVVYPEHSAHHSHPWLRHSLMRFTASILGWSLDLSLEPTTTEAADTCSLDGGLTASTAVEPKASDQFMGFTGGWESDDDDE